MEATAPASHDRTRYEGKKLLLLLLALFGPGFILFLKIVFSIVETGSAISSRQIAWLHGGSYAVLAVFFLLEIVCARYVQPLLPAARTRLMNAAQYAGVLLLCLFTSYCGAVTCEALGYEVFLRVGPQR